MLRYIIFLSAICLSSYSAVLTQPGGSGSGGISVAEGTGVSLTTNGSVVTINATPGTGATNSHTFFATNEFRLGVLPDIGNSYSWRVFSTNCSFVWWDGGSATIAMSYDTTARPYFPNGIYAPKIRDNSGSDGVVGQVLTATSSGSAWSNAPGADVDFVPSTTMVGAYPYTDFNGAAQWRDDSELVSFSEGFKGNNSSPLPSGLAFGNSGGGLVAIARTVATYPSKLGVCTITISNTPPFNNCYGYVGYQSTSSGGSVWWRTNSYFQSDFQIETSSSVPLTNSFFMLGMVTQTGANGSDDTSQTTDGIYLRLNPKVTTNFWAVCKRSGSSNAVEVTSVLALTNIPYSLKIYGSTNWTRFYLNGTNVANFYQKDGTNDALPTEGLLIPGCRASQGTLTNSNSGYQRYQIDKINFQE